MNWFQAQTQNWFGPMLKYSFSSECLLITSPLIVKSCIIDYIIILRYHNIIDSTRHKSNCIHASSGASIKTEECHSAPQELVRQKNAWQEICLSYYPPSLPLNELQTNVRRDCTMQQCTSRKIEILNYNDNLWATGSLSNLRYLIGAPPPGTSGAAFRTCAVNNSTERKPAILIKATIGFDRWFPRCVGKSINLKLSKPW